MRERVLHGPVQFRCLLFHSVAKASVLLRELYYHVAGRQHDLIRHETNGYPLTVSNSFSFLTIRDSIDLSPEISNVRGNGVTNTIACGFLQLVSDTRDACLENVEGNAGLSADFSPMPKCLSVYLKTKFWITGVNIRTDHIRSGRIGDSMSSKKSSRSSTLLFFLFMVNPRVNTRQAFVL